MPLIGGATDKFAGRYEALWTVSCMLDVMGHRADSIRLEPPGEEGEGVEFWIRRGDVREYHQVKRQHGAEGRWSLKELGRRAVLSTFWDKLSNPAAQCVFVSSHAAYQLSELSERSEGAQSWEEFDREFLSTQDSSQGFATLCNLWGSSSREEAFERLRRIHVRTIDEELLDDIVEVRLETLIEGDPSTASDVLLRLALESVHQELTAHDIWRHLEPTFRRRDWANDTRVLARFDEANSLYLSEPRRELILGSLIPREEASVTLDVFSSPNARRGVLLAGEAGVGKSGVVLQVLEDLRARKIPFLAFRVDRLEPTLLPNNIGQQLDLPGSPVAVLAAVAQDRDCVLVIDQLDAVSLASGRHWQLFEVVDKIIKQAAKEYPRMRLLAACRQFDLDNDPRIRRLTGEDGVLDTLAVEGLPEETVRETVAAMGIEAGRLDSKQVQLLSIPLHLSLLAEISSTPAARNLNFRTDKDLFDRFWDRKRAVLRQRMGRSVRWTEVVDALCDRMSERRDLSAPVERVEEYEDDAQAMASENVLVRDRNRYAFFHENFFDYAFARRFAGRERELLPFLREGEQHLFRRAQVRQILRHEREADFARYLEDLEELLYASDVRFHIKQLVFALLADLDQPIKEEWEILAPLLNEGEPYAREVYNVLRSPSWFRLADSLRLWERWLAEGDEESINRVIYVLWIAQRTEPDRVADLLEPYVSDPAWSNRFAYLMSGADLHTGRRFFDLFLRAIDEGVLDDADVPVDLYGLPDKNPERACEALYHQLKRRSDLSASAGQPNPFDLFSGTISASNAYEDLLTSSAQQAPRAFVTELLPFMLRLAEDLAERQGEPPYKDLIWSFSRYPRGGDFTNEVMLAAMEEALRSLAENTPEDFDPFARLLCGSDTETAQYLLIRAYAANGERYADEAVRYLLARPKRLETGYSNNPHWATRELLQAVTAHCFGGDIEKLEELILGYYSSWEQKEAVGDWLGEAQLTLLGGIEPSRRSPAVEERLKGWREKFGGDPKKPAPQVTIAGWVGPPIPEKETDSMTDEEWLAALARYSEDRHGW